MLLKGRTALRIGTPGFLPRWIVRFGSPKSGTWGTPGPVPRYGTRSSTHAPRSHRDSETTLPDGTHGREGVVHPSHDASFHQDSFPPLLGSTRPKCLAGNGCGFALLGRCGSPVAGHVAPMSKLCLPRKTTLAFHRPAPPAVRPKCRAGCSLTGPLPPPHRHPTERLVGSPWWSTKGCLPGSDRRWRSGQSVHPGPR